MDIPINYYSRVDITKISEAIKATNANERISYVNLAHIAEISERYDDMCIFVRELVKIAANGPDLTLPERNLLSISFKNTVGHRRAAWRILSADDNAVGAPAFRRVIEKEIEPCCINVLDLLENYLIPHPTASLDSKVFYQKMAGDYYRYLAEIRNDDENVKQCSAHYYGRAMKAAEETMEPTDPVRLGLALNYSVCLYEIVDDKNAACALARRAFDDALQNLTKLDPNDNVYRDCTLILQLLKDNLSLWVTPVDADE